MVTALRIKQRLSSHDPRPGYLIHASCSEKRLQHGPAPLQRKLGFRQTLDDVSGGLGDRAISRKGDGEAGAGADLTLYGDGAVMHLDGLLHQHQADARAANARLLEGRSFQR